MKRVLISSVLAVFFLSFGSCVQKKSKLEANNQEKKVAHENIQMIDTSNNRSFKLEAYNQAAQLVVSSLQEPTTAEFPQTKEKLEHIEYLGDNRFRVDSWVDSQDTYGAITRRGFSLRFRIDSSGITKEKFVIEEIGYIPEGK